MNGSSNARTSRSAIADRVRRSSSTSSHTIGELVAAEAGDGVGRRAARRCRRGPIARSSSSPAWWPSESLTTLRLSRSRKNSATWPAVAGRAVERVPQAVEQQRAVRQAGERVVQRVVAHLLLDAQAADRAGEHVRDRLQEVEVGLAERALGARVALSTPIGASGLPISTLTLETTPWRASGELCHAGSFGRSSMTKGPSRRRSCRRLGALPSRTRSRRSPRASRRRRAPSCARRRGAR